MKKKKKGERKGEASKGSTAATSGAGASSTHPLPTHPHLEQPDDAVDLPIANLAMTQSSSMETNDNTQTRAFSEISDDLLETDAHQTEDPSIAGSTYGAIEDISDSVSGPNPPSPFDLEPYTSVPNPSSPASPHPPPSPPFHQLNHESLQEVAGFDLLDGSPLSPSTIPAAANHHSRLTFSSFLAAVSPPTFVTPSSGQTKLAPSTLSNLDGNAEVDVGDSMVKPNALSPLDGLEMKVTPLPPLPPLSLGQDTLMGSVSRPNSPPSSTPSGTSMTVPPFGNQKYPMKLHRTPAIEHGGDSFIEGYSSDDEDEHPLSSTPSSVRSRSPQLSDMDRIGPTSPSVSMDNDYSNISLISKANQLKLDSSHQAEFVHPLMLSESDGDGGWNHRRSSDASNLSSHRHRFTSGNSKKSARVGFPGGTELSRCSTCPSSPRHFPEDSSFDASAGATGLDLASGAANNGVGCGADNRGGRGRAESGGSCPSGGASAPRGGDVGAGNSENPSSSSGLMMMMMESGGGGNKETSSSSCHHHHHHRKKGRDHHHVPSSSSHAPNHFFMQIKSRATTDTADTEEDEAVFPKKLKSLLQKRDLVSDDWDSGNSSISRSQSGGAKSKSQSGGAKAASGKKTHKRHSSSSIGSSAAISAKRCFNESEDTAASPNDPEFMQDVEEGGSPSAAAAAPCSASDVSFTSLYPAKAHGVEFKIEIQPEPQHRARYMTEGSRGAVRDKTGHSYPSLRLCGYKDAFVVQIFIGSETGRVKPHGFYQACKVAGKNTAPSNEKTIEGTTVIEIPFEGSESGDRKIVVDCVGILKLRNADVENRIGHRTKKRSTKARIVFRITLAHQPSDTSYTLQQASSPILCTQLPGLPEICKKSLSECPAAGDRDLFIVGKNFMKGTRVIFSQPGNDGAAVWEKNAEIDLEFFQQNHIICRVPPFKDQTIEAPIIVNLEIKSAGKLSDAQSFTYLPNAAAGVSSSPDAEAAEDALIKNSICSFPETQRREDVEMARVKGLELIGDELMVVREEAQQKIEVKEQAHSYGFTEPNELFGSRSCSMKATLHPKTPHPTAPKTPNTQSSQFSSLRPSKRSQSPTVFPPLKISLTTSLASTTDAPSNSQSNLFTFLSELNGGTTTPSPAPAPGKPTSPDSKPVLSALQSALASPPVEMSGLPPNFDTYSAAARPTELSSSTFLNPFLSLSPTTGTQPAPSAPPPFAQFLLREPIRNESNSSSITPPPLETIATATATAFSTACAASPVSPMQITASTPTYQQRHSHNHPLGSAGIYERATEFDSLPAGVSLPSTSSQSTASLAPGPALCAFESAFSMIGSTSTSQPSVPHASEISPAAMPANLATASSSALSSLKALLGDSSLTSPSSLTPTLSSMSVSSPPATDPAVSHGLAAVYSTDPTVSVPPSTNLTSLLNQILMSSAAARPAASTSVAQQQQQQPLILMALPPEAMQQLVKNETAQSLQQQQQVLSSSHLLSPSQQMLAEKSTVGVLDELVTGLGSSGLGSSGLGSTDTEMISISNHNSAVAGIGGRIGSIGVGAVGAGNFTYASPVFSKPTVSKPVCVQTLSSYSQSGLGPCLPQALLPPSLPTPMSSFSSALPMSTSSACIPYFSTPSSISHPPVSFSLSSLPTPSSSSSSATPNVDLTITLATQLLHQHLQKVTDSGSQGVEIQLLQALLQQQLQKQTQTLKQQQQQQNLSVATAPLALAPQPSFSDPIQEVPSSVEPKQELIKQPPFLPLESIIQSQSPQTPLLQSLQQPISTPQSPLPPIRPLVALEDLQPNHPLHQQHMSQQRQSQQQQSMVDTSVFLTAFSASSTIPSSSISNGSPLLTSLLTSFNAFPVPSTTSLAVLPAAPPPPPSSLSSLTALASTICAPLNSLGVPATSVANAAPSLDLSVGSLGLSVAGGNTLSYEVSSGAAAAAPLPASAVPFEAVSGSLALPSSIFGSTPATIAVPINSAAAGPSASMEMTATPKVATTKAPVSSSSVAQSIFGQEMPEMTFDEVNEYLQF